MTRLKSPNGVGALVGAAFVVLGQQLLPLGSQVPRTQTSGPCVGQVEFAELNGLDLVTAERAREVGAAAGLAVCVDVEKPQGMVRASSYFLFAWRGQVDQAKRAVFNGDEISREALLLPEGGGTWNENKLPDANWVGAGRRLPESAPNEATSALDRLTQSPIYKSVAKGRIPSISAVARRGSLIAWGASPPYDLYLRFGDHEFQRFQEIPAMGFIYVGRMDPTGTPIELQPGNIHLDPIK